ncbi:MAG: hypothetical protein ACXAEF_11840 [Candidatus Thorarchaeota archaeon]
MIDLRNFRRPSTLRIYSMFSNIFLTFSLILLLASVLGTLIVQSLTGLMLTLSVIILFIQIIFTISFVNKEHETGWIIHRLAYVTFFTMVLSLFLIAGSRYLISFYILGAGSLTAGGMISAICFTMLTCFGISLSALCFHTLDNEGIWKRSEEINESQ